MNKNIILLIAAASFVTACSNVPDDFGQSVAPRYDVPRGPESETRRHISYGSREMDTREIAMIDECNTLEGQARMEASGRGGSRRYGRGRIWKIKNDLANKACAKSDAIDLRRNGPYVPERSIWWANVNGVKVAASSETDAIAKACGPGGNRRLYLAGEPSWHNATCP